MKKYRVAFTLAEVMIVLAVIGIISAIIMPIAIQNIPKKEVMLFKKGHSTLYQVISTLVNSDTYYKDGDLGVKANGDRTNIEVRAGDVTYFCNSFADVVSAKSVNCSTKIIPSSSYMILNIEKDVYQSPEEAQEIADTMCKNIQSEIGSEIVTADGIHYYQTMPNLTYGISYRKALEYAGDNLCTLPVNAGAIMCGDEARLFSGPDKTWHKDGNGFDRVYKIFCMDIDGTGGEDPFGYGIRGDGKIFNGKRATEWLEMSLTED